MAKRLLLDILVKVLGEYIELDAGNFDLSLAVWSGHIELKNLKVTFINLNMRFHDRNAIHAFFCCPLILDIVKTS